MDAALLARVLWMRRILRRRERWAPERVAIHREEELRRLRRFAYEYSPFYQRYHSGLETRPLEELPVLTKAELMRNFDELITDRAVRLADVRAHLEKLRDDELFLGRYRVARTSGSTGNPGIFLSNALEWASIIASYSRSQEWAGILAQLTKRTRLAVVSSRVPWHQSARVGASVDSAFIPVRRFDATDALESIVAGLNEWQPENLIAYASMARALAEEQLEGRLRISPRAVMSASEVLTQETRARIRSAWGRDAFNVYAATETASVASECAMHRLHLFEDLVIAEIVDESNRPVPPGALGAKLLVTVLFSRTQPLIRYEISDQLLSTSERCNCGLPFALIGGVEGRAEDVLSLPSPDHTPVAIHPNVFHALLEPLAVQAWQVLEEAEGIRVLLARPSAEIDLGRLATEISAALERRGAAAPSIRIERVDAVMKNALGKAPLVKALRRSLSATEAHGPTE